MTISRTCARPRLHQIPPPPPLQRGQKGNQSTTIAENLPKTAARHDWLLLTAKRPPLLARGSPCWRHRGGGGVGDRFVCLPRAPLGRLPASSWPRQHKTTTTAARRCRCSCLLADLRGHVDSREAAPVGVQGWSTATRKTILRKSCFIKGWTCSNYSTIDF